MKTMLEVIRLDSIQDEKLKENIINQISFIFYMSSSLKEFSSEERKRAFFKRWCGDYIQHFSNSFFMMTEREAGELKVLGYLSGCGNSLAAQEVLEVPGFDVFSDLFERFPAHFHINFHPDCRGRGLGSQLVERYFTECKAQGCTGVHLVTSPGAANIPFYERLGFNHAFERSFKEMRLLFMGHLFE